HIPSLNPHVMGGITFTGDPLHGWMNLPAMALFTAAPCVVALRVYVALQPALAGLGIYWFLRSEGRSRAAATVGGLVLALPLAGSNLYGSLYLSASLAWTALLLASGSRFVRAASWSRR